MTGRVNLERVAVLYEEFVRLHSSRPTTDTAAALGITKQAAANRVARARNAGLLPPTTRGAAARPVHRPAPATIRGTDITWTVCRGCLQHWPCHMAAS